MRRKIYVIWRNFKRRCYNSSDKRYINYGGRNIVVCDEWKNSFNEFYNWALKNGYKDGLLIDRIDNDKNYEPNNCRFVTSAESAQNRNCNKLNIEKVIEIRKLFQENPNYKRSEICRTYNISRSTIFDVINRITWKNVLC